jgi:hypothetical protein
LLVVAALLVLVRISSFSADPFASTTISTVTDDTIASGEFESPISPLVVEESVVLDGSSSAMCAGPDLGVVADENLRVVDLEPQGAAIQAGIQTGDVLISIAPVIHDFAVEEVPFIQSRRAKGVVSRAGEKHFVCNDTSSSILESTLMLTPKPTIEPLPKATPTPEIISEAIMDATLEPLPTLMLQPAFQHGYDKVRIQVNRGGNEIQIMVKPFPHGPRPAVPDTTPIPSLPLGEAPTLTPLPTHYYYF